MVTELHGRCPRTLQINEKITVYSCAKATIKNENYNPSRWYNCAVLLAGNQVSDKNAIQLGASCNYSLPCIFRMRSKVVALDISYHGEKVAAQKTTRRVVIKLGSDVTSSGKRKR